MSPPSLLFAVPALPVADLDRAVSFYEDVLGFAPRVVKDGFAAVVRDGVELQLWTADGAEGSGAEAWLAGTGECWIAVADLDELADELAGRAEAAVTAEGGWTGGTEVGVRDVDGNAVTFHAAPPPDPPAG